MDAVKFLKELERMCDGFDVNCDGCPIYDIRKAKGDSCLKNLKRMPEECVSIVEKWSAEHPQKTRLQDFLEKHPNAPLEHFGAPWIRPVNLGYCNSKNCTGCDMQYSKSSAQCWNLPLEE